MTEKEHIQQLLDSYLAAETTREEEQLLSDYFCTHQDIPAEWRAFSVMFRGIRHHEQEPVGSHHSHLLKWVAAAALMAFVFGTGWLLMHQEATNKPSDAIVQTIVTHTADAIAPQQETTAPQQEAKVPQQEKPAEEAPPAASPPPRKSTRAPLVGKAQKENSLVKQPEALPDVSLPVRNPIHAEDRLHYASDVTPADISPRSPALMDDFIKKMAAYNGVEPEASDCHADSTQAGQACTFYVLSDTKETNVLGRLLLAAIAYNDTSPGYLLNYSHQQFFFTINDQRLERKYLWIAERIAGDRILLYSSHSPIGAEMPSTCYQKFRNKLTKTAIIQNTSEL